MSGRHKTAPLPLSRFMGPRPGRIREGLLGRTFHRGEKESGVTIKGRNLSQSESGGKAWGHHTGGFPEGGGSLYSVSHRQARRELWGSQHCLSAWRAPRGTRQPAHPPPLRSVPTGGQRRCLRCQRLGSAARVFPSRSPSCPAALASFHKLTSTFFSHLKCTTCSPPAPAIP